MSAIKTQVVIGRKWNRPEIYTHLCQEKIELALSLEDFVRALASEVGSPAMIVSRDTLLNKMLDAMPKVLEEIKKSSAEVV